MPHSVGNGCWSSFEDAVFPNRGMPLILCIQPALSSSEMVRVFEDLATYRARMSRDSWTARWCATSQNGKINEANWSHRSTFNRQNVWDLSPLLCISGLSFRRNSPCSESSNKSSEIAVIQHPGMKRGLILEAPTSEMKLWELRSNNNSQPQRKLMQLSDPGPPKCRMVFQLHTSVSKLLTTSLNSY